MAFSVIIMTLCTTILILEFKFGKVTLYCKVWCKSPWTVFWFWHIIYFLRDYQRLCKQLPKLINLQKIVFNADMFDESVLELWPEMATRGRLIYLISAFFAYFICGTALTCPLDDSHRGNIWCARIRQLSKDFWDTFYLWQSTLHFSNPPVIQVDPFFSGRLAAFEVSFVLSFFLSM